MKKILFSLALITAAFSAGAQTMYDAINYSRDNYYGTARTLGLGNAVTAIGGDLGTISINPAGSAVAGYSQFTISPGLTMSTTAASWAPSYFDGWSTSATYNSPQTFGSAYKDSRTKFIMPNIGVNLRLETGNKRGIVSYSFGFISNMSNNFLDRISSEGQNGAAGANGYLTSLSGAMAAGATSCGLDPSIMDYTDQYSSNFPWNYIAAYNGGLINFNDDVMDAETGEQLIEYYGSSETKFLNDDGWYEYFTPGVLNQRSIRSISGSKNDIVMNFGMNFNDNFFLGINLGVPVTSYRYVESFTEKSANPAEFPLTPEFDLDGKHVVDPLTYFDEADYYYKYNSDVSGIYAKVGFIWLPTSNLRLGAAVKTPTAYTISETWRVDVDTYFTNPSGHENASTPDAENNYNFRSPYSLNVGAAYTLGKAGMVSVDYEFADYSIMRYSTLEDYYTSNPFYYVNRLNQLFCGSQHSLRIGAEYRPTPFVTLRAGYNFTTNPEKVYTDNEGYTVDATYYDNNFDFYENGNATLQSFKYVKAPITSLSCGIGITTPGSFFADFALRRTTYPSEYFSPYSTYIFYDDNSAIVSPCVKSDRNLIDAVLTLGWRF